METFRIRGGRPRDKDALMAFYTTDERDTLPSPSYPDLIDALEKQSLLIVEGRLHMISMRSGVSWARSS
jgi:hypothetical protein